MTVTDHEPGAPKAPPPPPPDAPQAPQRAQGPARPGAEPSPTPSLARGGRPQLWKLGALATGIFLLMCFAGCGALIMSRSPDGSEASATSTTLAPGADELTELNPGVWFPEYTTTARELIGPGRDKRLEFAKKVNDMVYPPTKSQPAVPPCEIWMNKDVYVELTWQKRWTPDYPVPVFRCPRSDSGAYLPPAQTTVTGAVDGHPTTSAVPANGAPKGE